MARYSTANQNQRARWATASSESAGATSMTQSSVLLTENREETTGYHGEATNSSLYSIGGYNSGKTEWHFPERAG